MRKNSAFEKLVIAFNSGIKTGAQTYLANKAKIPTQTISAWINGRSVPTKENVLQLAKILKKDIKEIQNIFEEENQKGKDNINNSDNEKINLKLLLNLIEKQNKFMEEQIKRIDTEKSLLQKEVDFLKVEIKILEDKNKSLEKRLKK